MPEQPDDFSEYDSDELSEINEERNIEQVLKEGDLPGLLSNPNLNKMLIESYKWHLGRENGNNNKNDFPILVLVDAFDWWSEPHTPFYLDTYDMTLTVDDKKIQLPLNSDGTGNEELDIWYNEIILYTLNSRSSLRFYDRRDLKLS